jgi:hypothetical protein
MYLKNIAGETFLTKGVNGYAPESIDPERVTFEQPIRDERGITFKVFYDGKPLPATVVKDALGNETAIGESVTFDSDDLTRVNAFTAKEQYKKGLDEKIEENKKAQEKYTRTQKIAEGPNPVLSTGGMPSGEQDFAGEIDLLKAEKAKADAEFEARFSE